VYVLTFIICICVPSPLYYINNQHDFEGWGEINVSCYMIKLDFWPWPPCWKMVPVCLYIVRKGIQRYFRTAQFV